VVEEECGGRGSQHQLWKPKEVSNGAWTVTRRDQRLLSSSITSKMVRMQVGEEVGTCLRMLVATQVKHH
jgi:hypothetical protein